MRKYNASPFQLPARRPALLGAAAISLAILAGCATTTPPPAVVPAPAAVAEAAPGVVEPLAEALDLPVLGSIAAAGGMLKRSKKTKGPVLATSGARA